ncbi:MAG TPA: DUF4253 domain-containing protein [Nitrospirota bacterium]|nr:DUF4253 domain-containing protein [Nitrospirota bacterium]
MKRFVSRLLSHMAAAGAVLCLMGADGQMKSATAISGAETTTNGPASGLTSSITGSAAGKTSNSLSAGATGSVASKPTHSLTTGATGSAAVTSKPTVTLSPYAEELVKILKFDRQVAILVKEVTSEHIQRLVGYDENDYQIIAPGIAVAVPEDKTDRILAQLRRKLVPLRYLPFVVEMNEGLKRDKIGIIKGTDQYEILRIMHTNGDQYDISNEDLIERLKEWEKITPFTIIGADGDWVELEFRTLPKDLKAFAEEVYEFSPEAVEQGAGSVEELMKEIKKTNRLFLSWD